MGKRDVEGFCQQSFQALRFNRCVQLFTVFKFHGGTFADNAKDFSLLSIRFMTQFRVGEYVNGLSWITNFEIIMVSIAKGAAVGMWEGAREGFFDEN